jgi:hypothetical protein
MHGREDAELSSHHHVVACGVPRLGAGVGTVIALGTHGTEATLPVGTRMNVRTTQTLVLR